MEKMACPQRGRIGGGGGGKFLADKVCQKSQILFVHAALIISHVNGMNWSPLNILYILATEYPSEDQGLYYLG